MMYTRLSRRQKMLRRETRESALLRILPNSNMSFNMTGSYRMEPLLSPRSSADEYRPVPDDGQADVAGYNKELAQLGNPSWFNVPWLYAECYLYRWVICSSSMVSIY